MKVPIADLRAQYLSLKQEIDAAAIAVFESSAFIGGEQVRLLEEEIAQACGALFGVGVASGTDALVLSLKACDIGPGCEVITTPFTFGATSEAIALVGATPVYVDIDDCTYNLDASAIEAAITPNTKALLPVDLFGQMADRAALRDIAAKHNLKLIIDSAQSIGSRQNGRHIGADGDTTTLSFYPTKNIGAFGDGGMILTNGSSTAALLRSLRDHGQSAYGIHDRVGYCSRLDAVQAAILRVKLSHLAAWNEQRRANAARYMELLADIATTDGSGLTLPGHERGNYHIYHQFTIRHRRRTDLQEHLRAQQIDTKIFYPQPMHLQKAYARPEYAAGDFPRAESAAREVLSLPVHPGLTDEQIQFVSGSIRDFLA